MCALGFLLCFLLIQLAAQVDSSGEHQGSACVILELPDTIYPLVVGQGNSLYWLTWLHSWTEARMEL